jgi:hypothetical protein
MIVPGTVPGTTRSSWYSTVTNHSFVSLTVSRIDSSVRTSHCTVSRRLSGQVVFGISRAKEILHKWSVK